MSTTHAFNCTEMTRMVMCDEDYFKKIVSKKYSPEVYADYTVYLVNRGVAPVEDQDEQHPITDLYFGSRKVTDVIPVTEYPGDSEYPDDKIYLQSKCSNNVPLLSGDQGHKVYGTIVGYQMYYKHKGQVIPISTSLISEINPILDDFGNLKTVGITWNSKDHQGYYTELVTSDYVSWYFKNLPDEDLEVLKNKISSEIIERLAWKPIGGN